MGLCESCDDCDTAQSLIFVHGIRTEFETTDELEAMHSTGTLTGSVFFHTGNYTLG